MPGIHRAIGFAIVIGWGGFFLWGVGAFVVRREPNEWYWRLLGVLQVALVLQLMAGLILLITGRRLPGLLHLLYGAVFPGIVLVVAHVLGRGMDDERDTWKVFAIASFFTFGLVLRALTTGLGLP